MMLFTKLPIPYHSSKIPLSQKGQLLMCDNQKPYLRLVLTDFNAVGNFQFPPDLDDFTDAFEESLKLSIKRWLASLRLDFTKPWKIELHYICASCTKLVFEADGVTFNTPKAIQDHRSDKTFVIEIFCDTIVGFIKANFALNALEQLMAAASRAFSQEAQYASKAHLN